MTVSCLRGYLDLVASLVEVVSKLCVGQSRDMHLALVWFVWVERGRLRTVTWKCAPHQVWSHNLIFYKNIPFTDVGFIVLTSISVLLAVVASALGLALCCIKKNPTQSGGEHGRNLCVRMSNLKNHMQENIRNLSWKVHRCLNCLEFV